MVYGYILKLVSRQLIHT